MEMKLSDTQKRIYAYLLRCETEQGYPPTVREIGAEIGLKSPSTVHFHLKALEKAGLITRHCGKGRAISLNHTQTPPQDIPTVTTNHSPQMTDIPSETTDIPPIRTLSPGYHSSAVVDTFSDGDRPSAADGPRSHGPYPAHIRIPIVGNVAAGNPIPAQENIEDYLTFDPGDRQGEYFALTVRGMSMRNAGILPGDLVVVRRQPDARNGEIVVALLGDEATVKRFSEQRGHIRLLPENDACQPIDGTHARILGKVTAVVRRY